ncbi:hypothetical protein K432DRAFT_122364 [Lepidopterella palustris CBS 459.81]|uniref:Uncharacterized protein n=1 Tax=Lepidopterella palustris CBS 459.81 TaxID=1314670 RepID=A0A8E2E534_9PEZI|nr:hypothetical protein K432DRAFT_122364 [Lepidopterella palustris CBS 459.81]
MDGCRAARSRVVNVKTSSRRLRRRSRHSSGSGRQASDYGKGGWAQQVRGKAGTGEERVIKSAPRGVISLVVQVNDERAAHGRIKPDLLASEAMVFRKMVLCLQRAKSLHHGNPGGTASRRRAAFAIVKMRWDNSKKRTVTTGPLGYPNCCSTMNAEKS